MAVIAMTREMGSRGREVALGISEALSIALVQHELVEHVAERMHARESSVNHLLEGTDTLFERWGVNREDLSLYTREEIVELAEEGDVLFRGWGAVPVLRPIPHVVCVRICASAAARTREVMTRIGIDDVAVARREVSRSDAAHERVMAQIFHADWRDSLLYDVVLNTDRISIDRCVDIVVDLARSADFAETDASRALVHRMKLDAAIHRALRENEVTRRANPSFDATLLGDTNQVVLTGMVYDQQFRRAAIDVVASVPGVASVVDSTVLPTFNHYGA